MPIEYFIACKMQFYIFIIIVICICWLLWFDNDDDEKGILLLINFFLFKYLLNITFFINNKYLHFLFRYKMGQIKFSVSNLLNSKGGRKRKSFSQLTTSMKKKIKKEVLDLINSNQRITELLKEHDCNLGDIGCFGEEKNETQKRVMYEKICQAKDLCFISDANMEKFRIITGLDIPKKKFDILYRKQIQKQVPKSTRDEFGNYNFMK